MNFLGAFSQIGRLLPGFMEGERAAIKDNWQDAINRNNVWHGQLQNLYDEATWDPAVSNAFYTNSILQDNATSSLMNLLTNMAGMRNNMFAAQANTPEFQRLMQQFIINRMSSMMNNEAPMQNTGAPAQRTP